MQHSFHSNPTSPQTENPSMLESVLPGVLSLLIHTFIDILIISAFIVSPTKRITFFYYFERELVHAFKRCYICTYSNILRYGLSTGFTIAPLILISDAPWAFCLLFWRLLGYRIQLSDVVKQWSKHLSQSMKRNEYSVW